MKKLFYLLFVIIVACNPYPLPDPIPDPIQDPLPDPIPDPIQDPIPDPVLQPTPIEQFHSDINKKVLHVENDAFGSFFILKDNGKFMIADFYGGFTAGEYIFFIGNYTVVERGVGFEITLTIVYVSINITDWLTIEEFNENQESEIQFYIEYEIISEIVNFDLKHIDSNDNLIVVEAEKYEYPDYSYLYGTWNATTIDIMAEMLNRPLNIIGEEFDFKGAVFISNWKEVSEYSLYMDESFVLLNTTIENFSRNMLKFYAYSIYNFTTEQYDDYSSYWYDAYVYIDNNTLDYYIHNNDDNLIELSRGENTNMSF